MTLVGRVVSITYGEKTVSVLVESDPNCFFFDVGGTIALCVPDPFDHLPSPVMWVVQNSFGLKISSFDENAARKCFDESSMYHVRLLRMDENGIGVIDEK